MLFLRVVSYDLIPGVPPLLSPPSEGRGGGGDQHTGEVDPTAATSTDSEDRHVSVPSLCSAHHRHCWKKRVRLHAQPPSPLLLPPQLRTPRVVLSALPRQSTGSRASASHAREPPCRAGARAADLRVGSMAISQQLLYWMCPQTSSTGGASDAWASVSPFLEGARQRQCRPRWNHSASRTADLLEYLRPSVSQAVSHRSETSIARHG